MKTLDEIQLPPNERAAIRAAAEVLRDKLPVTQVILFGSKARGDSDAESDIDLLLLTVHRFSRNKEQKVMDILRPIQDQYDVFFGPIEISEEDWFHGVYQVMPLRDEVDRDGVAA